MSSHLLLMVLFSLFVSVVFSALMRDDPREQAVFAAKLLVAFVGAGILAGWVLYPLPL
jgi:hypothetical protein